MSTEREFVLQKVNTGLEYYALAPDLDTEADPQNSGYESPQGVLFSGTASVVDKVYWRKQFDGVTWYDRHHNTTADSGGGPGSGAYDNALDRTLSCYTFVIPNDGNVPASGTITIASQPTNNATLVIGVESGLSRTYTWKTTLTPAPNEILSEADTTQTAANLILALSGTASASGTKYGAGTVPHAGVTATNQSTNVVTIKAIRDGALGNLQALTSSTGTVTVSGAGFLTGGGQQSVVSTTGLWTSSGVQCSSTVGYYRSYSERLVRWTFARTTTGSIGFNLRHDSSTDTTIAVATGLLTKEVLNPAITLAAGVLNVTSASTIAYPCVLHLWARRILP